MPANDVLDSHESQLYIGGSWTDSADGRMSEVQNPATRELAGRAMLGGPADIDNAVAAARKAFEMGPWPGFDVSERVSAIHKLAEALRANSDRLAALLTAEVGTPLTMAARQVASAAGTADYMADLATRFPWSETRAGLTGDVEVRRVPVGVAGAIVPWNFPLSMAVGKLAPALLTGSTIVLKPAAETPLAALLLAQILDEVGLPPGVVNIVAADRDVSELLVRHKGVDMITFTGSTAVGKRVASLCGEQVKRYALELGGKSPAILLDDVDLDSAMPHLAPMTMYNSGQTCVNQTRVLAPRSRYADVVEAITEQVRAFQVGDPEDESTYIGPLINERQRARVEGYIRSGVQDGARVTTGGGRPGQLDRGYFLEPTVFADVDNKMTIATEEIFGPVVAVIPYDDDADGISIANDSDYGLACTVWSSDTERATRVARQIRAGNVGVNGIMVDPAAPYGGFKQSGIGREMGPEGLAEFTEFQTIVSN